MSKLDEISQSYAAWKGVWGTNTINASVTGILSSLASVGSVLSTKGIYDYYKQQESLYIQDAEEQARRIKLKGALELRNLKVKNAQARGRNELAVAAAGGRLSGSALDVLTTNNKYNVMDEHTVSLQTLWDASEAKRRGYQGAMGVASKAMATASEQTKESIRGFTSFIKGMSASLLEDSRQYASDKARMHQAYALQGAKMDQLLKIYGLDLDEALAPGKINQEAGLDPESDTMVIGNPYERSTLLNEIENQTNINQF